MTDFNIIRQYNFPTIIRFGAGAVKELPDHLEANRLSQAATGNRPGSSSSSIFSKQIKKDLVRKWHFC